MYFNFFMSENKKRAPANVSRMQALIIKNRATSHKKMHRINRSSLKDINRMIQKSDF